MSSLLNPAPPGHIEPDRPAASPRSAFDDFQVIYFGNDWLAENRTSSHHIALRIGGRVPLLYVETPGTRAPQLTGRDCKKLLRKLCATLAPPRRVGARMWVITIPQIPLQRLPFIRRLNRVVSALLLRRAQRRLGFQNTISWFTVPHVAELAGRIGERFVVYYCIDDYAAFPHVDPVETKRLDDELTRKADQVFVASPILIEGKQKLNSTAVYSPHGVDFDHFCKACDPDLAVPALAEGLERPVIGFFGLIETWVDLDIIEAVARARRGWTFLMVGRVAVNVGALKSLPNVIWAGPQPYATLPAWSKAFDVAIIPYRHTPQTHHANPLKLREYLAAGRPVVTVRTPEIEKFAEHVRICDDPEDFIGQIESAMRDETDAAREARMRTVQATSWDARVAEALAVVTRRLEERYPGRSQPPGLQPNCV